MSPPNPRHRVDGWVIAIIGGVFLVTVGAPIGLLIYQRSQPSILDLDRPPPLTALARSVQTLDEKSAVALAEEFLAQRRHTDVAWAEVRLAPEADPRVFSLIGARAAFDSFGGKERQSAVDLCLTRGPDGWALWERFGGCDVQIDRGPVMLPSAEREALLKQMVNVVWKRRMPAAIPKTCEGLETATHAEVGFIDWQLRQLPPGALPMNTVQLTSTVVDSCPAKWSPLLDAWGGCGLDAPWKYAVVFELPGQGYARATAQGGSMKGTIEVIDIATGSVLCKQELAFAIGEKPFTQLPDGERGPAQKSYRTRAYAAVCASVKSIGGGKLPTLRWWRCDG